MLAGIQPQRLIRGIGIATAPAATDPMALQLEPSKEAADDPFLLAPPASLPPARHAATTGYAARCRGQLGLERWAQRGAKLRHQLRLNLGQGLVVEIELDFD